MVRFRLVAAVLFGLAVLSAANPALAKGPFETVVTGGDLRREVRIPADEMERVLARVEVGLLTYNGTSPQPLPRSDPYRVSFSFPGDRTTPESFYLYYPGVNGRPGMMRQSGCLVERFRCWAEVDRTFDVVLRSYIDGRAPVHREPGPPVLAPTVTLLLIISVLWLVRRGPIRTRLERLAY